MHDQSNEVWIINGIPGSGKTTTARALAKTFKRGAHIEGDKVQDLIVSGNVSPGQLPQDEEARQIDLCVTNQCVLAKSFSAAGFILVIDYVVVNESRIQQYLDQLEGLTVYLITLNPGIETALRRDHERTEKTVAAMWAHLAKEIEKNIDSRGLWIDNSKMTVENVVESVMNNKEQAMLKA